MANALAADGPQAAVRGVALHELTQSSAVEPVLQLDDSTGAVKWLTGRWVAPAPGRVVESSYRFLEANRIAFGVVSPRDEFVLLQVTRDDQLPGWRDVSFEQRVNGLPLLHARIAFHYDGDGRLVAVNGDYLPSPDVPATPALSADEAADAAVAASATLPDALDPPTTAEQATRRDEPFDLVALPVVRLAYYRYPTGGLSRTR
jgi:hypothetical protein